MNPTRHNIESSKDWQGIKAPLIDTKNIWNLFYKLDLLDEEIKFINPKIIILFGNQVSSIILNEKIFVSQCRKKYYIKEINNISYKFYPVYYPVGNSRFNIDKSI